ncbi:hypothetical protein [Cyclonatronum proteinivorum]|nr:hypothetical protein [Cyclonatronum proteinivorum]
MRLSKALMQLFWTAGPVTAIGLTLGYYIGYGKMPPTELMIYFISFTVFSGLTGLIAKLVYDTTRGHLSKTRELDMKFVCGELGSLVLDIRNLQVEAYEGSESKREAALQLIRRVELSSYGVYLAFTDLTKDRKTGLILGRIHTYRKAGLFSYVNNMQNRFSPYISGQYEQLKASSPDAALLLNQHFGEVKRQSLRQGVVREPYFIQRIFAAVEKEDPWLITLKDAEEFIILCIELISDREFPILYFSYRGNWSVAEAFDSLERKRLALNMARAKGSNRLFALAAYLRESGVCDETRIPKGLKPEALAEHLFDELDQLAQSVRQDVAARKSTGELKEKKLVLKNGLKLYELAQQGYAQVKKAQEQYAAAIQRWDKESRKNPVVYRFIGSRWMRKGIDVRERTLSLSDEHKDELIRHLNWYFRHDGIAALLKTTKAQTADDDKNESDYYERCETVRRLVIETALVLSPMIGLSKPEVQRNLNSTKAIYLGELSPDQTAYQKQQLFEQLVTDTDNNTGLAAERMAHTMLNVYQIPLDDEAIQFLHLNYGASVENLKIMAEKAEETGGSTGLFQYDQSAANLQSVNLKPVPGSWRKVLR